MNQPLVRSVLCKRVANEETVWKVSEWFPDYYTAFKWAICRVSTNTIMSQWITWCYERSTDDDLHEWGT